jgi:cytochrome c-type biogenesis protein CcmE
MNKQVLVRVAVSALVLVGATSLLFFLTLREDAAFYKKVDEVMVNPSQWYGKSLQLHGFAANIQKSTTSFDYRFIVKNGEYEVKAMYHGSVPDTFKDGAELVLKGREASQPATKAYK